MTRGMPDGSKTAREPGWLLLIHQIPPKPKYFRVKIWRRLQRLGAVGIKNSVYALPASDQAHEDLNWVLREIVEGGGDASPVEARFVEGLRDKPGELRFDMFDGEYTHKGELCTFEVLLRSFEITDAALRPIAEMIHDIDLKVDTYNRPETPGFAQLVNAMAMAHREDEARLARASAVLDDLYEFHKRKRPDRGRGEER